MKKWIDSYYHYMVPEVDDTLTINVKPDFLNYLADVKRGIDTLGDKAVPVIIGPVTMVHLCSFKCEGRIETNRLELFEKIVPVYSKLLSDLVIAGAKEVQIHEPSLVFDDASLIPIFQKRYEGPNSILPLNVMINFVSFFEDVGESNYKWLISMSKIDIISVDLTRGDNLSLIKKFGFPSSKTLGAGLIDGRNVWKINPCVVDNILKELDYAKVVNIRIQPSCSLQFVPWNLEGEKALLDHTAGPVLAFSKQKLVEVVSIAKNDLVFLEDAKAKWATYLGEVSSNKGVAARVASLKASDFARQEQFETRRKQQTMDLPIVPTTTIGSFPQTKEIRSLRSQYKCNKITKKEYDSKINEQIAFMIGVQEALGLDILVHGEPERTDMVEYFGQQMEGMLFSQNGWVQSFGSRCVRPPIFWGDISRTSPMTVREFKVAQAFTQKPVKGMLTGPVTILNWSFPRVDISRKIQAFQIALALRDEIKDLEEAGCRIIQVDEPALREAMPLRPSAREEYLNWTVDAFRLATAGAASSNQIHTHMCYCEFDDCMEAIDRMDTDVISIENARSDDATLRAFHNLGYTKGLGPGTYDIHSPVVPSQDFIVGKIKSFLACMKDKKLLVINPDCGLKTRAWNETIGSLKNMVAAAKHIRSELEDESFDAAVQ
jgi:5-methyltetrahydropteroyltriglutamate--homocysteine methyltransferase